MDRKGVEAEGTHDLEQLIDEELLEHVVGHLLGEEGVLEPVAGHVHGEEEALMSLAGLMALQEF